MNLNYGISLWNFSHYNYRQYEGGLPELKGVLADTKEFGYSGIELWRYWKGEDIFQHDISKAICDWACGLKRSLHTEGAKTFEEHKVQIHGAKRCGVDVVVLHPNDIGNFTGIGIGQDYRPNIALTRQVVSYASAQNITIALENGELEFLVEAIENVDDLKICLDVGHVCIEPDRKKAARPENKSLTEYLEKLRPRIVHLHLQDVLPESERHFPDAGLDHYPLGTGAIPEDDWKILLFTLKKIDFNGLAVFEIRPRNPFLLGNLGIEYLNSLIS